MKNISPEPIKVNALVKFLACPKTEAKTLLINEDYLVFDDHEAEDQYEEELENYFEEIVSEEIPENYRFYIDRERWLWDAQLDTCRGNILSLYDGKEHEIEIENQRFYIYRRN